ncbi:response regulator transcription factor [Clostridium folliculivorans]|uniref:Stage 0 sporulation protein A homolog n=1 Tax=Clostridium folliculivorans TaxID=2886038 RepID=A0A9W6DB95_9CLOT|nr:response regulator transcription factor [Clostridium folliculivorans]GKU25771.1 DNA-binding response regulator [Clostridium folliculivorans]GKU28792.1 DNA-binding response regulator [Clostridium folliculivorans]
MYKIMIIEDEEKIRDIITASLKKWGFDVCCVEDFSDIVGGFVSYSPSLVLMDINLPIFDGFHWCNQIRNISKVPVLFLSSRNTNMDIVMAVNMGGDDYITKPFSMEVLIAKINAVLRRTYSYSDASIEVINYNGVLLSLKDNTLYYESKSVELTKNEFKILYVLMKSHERIVSREKIMQELWEDESFIDDNTLTVNINRLRRKLNEMGLEEYIKTVKNQGYMVK